MANNLPGPGPGRPKGSQNKVNKLLKEAIMKAAEKAGDHMHDATGGEATGKEKGLVGFLFAQALKKENSSFMTLLGKVLPMQVTGAGDGPLIDMQSAVDKYLSGLTNEQLAALESVSAALAASQPDDGEDSGGEE